MKNFVRCRKNEHNLCESKNTGQRKKSINRKKWTENREESILQKKNEMKVMKKWRENIFHYAEFFQEFSYECMKKLSDIQWGLQPRSRYIAAHDRAPTLA